MTVTEYTAEDFEHVTLGCEGCGDPHYSDPCPRCQHAADTATETETRATIDYLRLCIAARNAGHLVSYTTDPAWLINIAINRRAGEVEDHHSRAHGPLNHRGQLGRKYRGDWQRHMRQIANEVNTPRLIVHRQRLGEHQWLADRLPERFGQ